VAQAEIEQPPDGERPPDAIGIRLHQQELISAFGLFALTQNATAAILQEACRLAAEGMRTRFAKVLERLGGEQGFLICAGVGWRAGVVGQARIPGGLGSAAGYALATGEPVISNELATESRFRTAALLVEHGVVRAINVVIKGVDEPYGVLEVDSSHEDAFTERDIAFLQALANTIAAVLQRERDRAALHDSTLFARSVLEASLDCIKVLDAEGRVQFVNANGLCLLVITDTSRLYGKPWAALWPAHQAALIEDAVRQANSTGSCRFQAPCPTASGSAKWWDVSVCAVPATATEPRRLVAISRDITEQVYAEEALRQAAINKDALLREKDLLMREVHHRVTNSLQLVQTLLSLQARGQTDPQAKLQLQEAAGRVVTVGAVHKRLYQGGSVTEADAATYLEGLLEDLQASLAYEAAGRAVELVAEPMMLAADHLTPLGLVTTELVTNALKYGSGRVTVRVRPSEAGAEIVVEDEGAGFPPDFAPGRSRGLGMRIITALAKTDAEAIWVDRSVPHGRIIANLKLREAGAG
jgi:PAS domain S-box-containing protein